MLHAGSIPAGIDMLVALETFDVSHNELEGKSSQGCFDSLHDVSARLKLVWASSSVFVRARSGGPCMFGSSW